MSDVGELKIGEECVTRQEQGSVPKGMRGVLVELRVGEYGKAVIRSKSGLFLVNLSNLRRPRAVDMPEATHA